MKSPFSFLVIAVLLLTDCNQLDKAESAGDGSETIEAISHIHWAIDHFSVNEQPGVDIVGPRQGDGGTGYPDVLSKWEPGMAVKIEWETGIGYSMDSPGSGDDKKVLEWEKK